jgi:hypothetical protein
MNEVAKMKVDEIWANEGCIRLRIEPVEGGSVAFSIVDTSRGWPGEVVAMATIASFRLERIVAVIGGNSWTGPKSA